MKAIPSLVVAAALACAPAIASAQDATHQNATTLPHLTVETGLGAGAPNLGDTMFSYGGVKVTGASLGLLHPTAFLFETSTRYYPFSIRNFGLLATVEMLLLNGDGGVHDTPTGPVGRGKDDGPTYYSVELGPEAQMRFGSFIVRAAALVGWRDAGVGNYEALDWRVSARTQVDYLFGGLPSTSGLALGAFGGVDVWPGLGWTAGVTFSYALF